MVYHRCRISYPPQLWWLGGDIVAECSSYRYLGVHLQEDGNFSVHVDDLIKRGKQRLGMLRHMFLRGGRLPGSLARVLLMAHMLGVLESGAAVWVCQPPPGLVEKLDSVWKHACRAVLGVHHTTPTAAVMGDLELMPLEIRRAMLVANLYHKVAAAPPGSIVAEVFAARRVQFLSNRVRPGRAAPPPLSFTWLQQVDDALRLLGLSEHFLFLELDREQLLSGALTRSTWKVKVLQGARAATKAWWQAAVARHHPTLELLHRSCPDGPARAAYIESRAGRRKAFLAELRAGALPLRASAFARRRLPRLDAGADVSCRLCGGEDDSLLHFLFRCSALAPIRRLGEPFWARLSSDLDGVARVLSGFAGSPHGFQRITSCWYRMWCFRRDCLNPKVDSDSFALRWPGLTRSVLPRPAPAAVAAEDPGSGAPSHSA
jgi:hypothetical protein